MAQNTVELISEAFDRHEIRYRRVDTETVSFIDAGFNIKGGPTVRFHFFSQGDKGNDVQVRIIGLMNKVNPEKTRGHSRGLQPRQQRDAFSEILYR